MDPAAAIRAAGFAVREEEHPPWMDVQRRVFELALEAGDPGDDAALRALQDEARSILPIHDELRRVLVVAQAPG
ncbi:MAG: hypothetical protein ACRDRZ_03805 [Pseudonocardiaceae bacterium]